MKSKEKLYVRGCGCRSRCGAGAAAGHVAWLLALVAVSTSTPDSSLTGLGTSGIAEDFCTVHLTAKKKSNAK